MDFIDCKKNKIIVLCDCNHKTILWKKTLSIYKRLYDNINDEILLCDKCKNEFINHYIPTANEINEQIINLNNIKTRIDEYFLKTFCPYIYNAFLNFTKEFDTDWNTKFYMFKHNMNSFPICKCGKPIKNMNKKVFYKFCSSKCRNKDKNRKKLFTKILKKYHKDKKELIKINFKNNYPKFNFNIKKIVKNNNLLIEDYCEHGDVLVDKKIFKFLYENRNNINEHKYILCKKCLANIEKNISTYKFKYDVQIKAFNKMHKNAHTKKSLQNKYVDLYLSILKNSIDIKTSVWSEKLYLFKNNKSQRNKCTQNNCNNECKFNTSKNLYNFFCKEHINNFTISKKEQDLYNFVKCNYDKIVLQSYRNISKKSKKELDIYVPLLKLGIEFNGLYWHAGNNDHYYKWKLCRENGINLLTIWEDDWEFKKDIVKSIILDNLGCLTKKIYAKDCTLQNISFIDSENFLEKNHLLGNCTSSINIGLYYKDELVSLMSFKKLNNLEDNKYELLRFCNILNVNIIDAASKLFNYFISNYKPYKIISYANCDMNYDNLYNTLGFKQIEYKEGNYWWVKNGIRYNSSNFIKYKLIKEGENPQKTEDEILREKGYLKIYGTGITKWIF